MHRKKIIKCVLNAGTFEQAFVGKTPQKQSCEEKDVEKLSNVGNIGGKMGWYLGSISIKILNGFNI